MGDSRMHSRAVALLKSGNYSDVEIQVIDGETCKTFQTHKLFLAMGSKVFGEIFFNKTESPKFLKIYGFQPAIVYMMLEYLYTNKLVLDNIKEARELYSLSKRYGMRNLQELCVDYISQNEINEDNVLHMYDCALKENFMNLLANCREIVSSNTKAVIKSPSFIQVSLAVLEDIVQLENLNVESELDIIYAAIEWARYECRRQKLPVNDNIIKKCLSPLIPYLRFLSLKSEEFSTLVKKHNILSAYESFVVTSKLMEPKKNISFPHNLCVNFMPRKNLFESVLCSSNISEPIMKSPNKPPHLTKLNNPKNLIPPLKKMHIPPTKFSKSQMQKKSLVSKVFPLVRNTTSQTFDFPLQEMEKHFSTAFNNDVKCSLSITLLKGEIHIQGVLLKIIQKPNVRELMDVILNISSSEKNSSKNNILKVELKDGFLPLTFNQPVKVSESNPVEIEVTIEDLQLNRCCIVKNSTCQLICKPEVKANLLLTCNQTNGSGHLFFFINRLYFIID